MTKKRSNVIHLKFEDNNLARNLFGPQETHLKSLETQIGVDIHVRGGELSIEGNQEQVHFAENVLTQLYDLMKKGHPILGQDIERAIKILHDDRNASLHQIFLDSVFIPSRRKGIYPRSAGGKG